jgi:hypothetical protein
MNKTTNGANCYDTTCSKLLDFFASLSTYRTNQDLATQAFIDAYDESPKYAMRALFYLRDIRNIGIGERSSFRKIISDVFNMENAPILKNHILQNIENIPYFGRFDDMFNIAYDTKSDVAKRRIYTFLHNALQEDIKGYDNGTSISILAKWCPSINTSSYRTVSMAKEFISYINMRESDYRKLLSKLRAVLNIVEKSMSSGNWEEIDYSTVPSLAMKKYTNAFIRNTGDRFREYINRVASGEDKINASTLYPYDIVYEWVNGTRLSDEVDRIKIEQWKALPNIEVGKNSAIVVADTSGSMFGVPIATAIGLGVYFAEKNTGVWRNKMITFSEDARYVEFSSFDNVKEKIETIPSIVENTNIMSVFELLFNTAVYTGKKEVPNIIIITDMQFDEGVEAYDETIYENCRKKFEKAGIKMPNVIYWNVGSYTDSFQVNSGVRGVQFASGHSINVFKTVMASIDCTPYEAMIKTLDNKVFDLIK